MLYNIHQLPTEERPRERLVQHGPESMSTTELVAIILGSGTKGMPVMQLAQELIVHFGSLKSLSEATIAELRQIKGVGLTKAIQLKAIFSLINRLGRHITPPRYRIDHPLHAYHLLKDDLHHEKRELVVAVLLDVKSYLISHEVVSIGTLSNSLVHPREVFYPAIRHKAASLILAHNHPSGDPSPSPEDLAVTKTFIKIGQMMGIPLNDHIIIGEDSYVSIRQSTSLFD